ncbi:MAG: DUF5686 and carboxypeptidase regulatory-like domain-containing protein [Cytophagales bacterium]|nr:DUF5686 and carboxypeptidase regulatory-like domain-containing protein [Cytophagales bacterium]MDW8384575.1 DUF5686 family protein [Flammeovirgaceae bacterium]
MTVIYFCCLLILVFSYAHAQKTIITGKVTDASTGEGIPFANVYLKSSKNVEGTTTDFEGNYRLISENPPSDTLWATSVGYQPKYKLIQKNKEQIINFQLTEGIELQEVVITKRKYENPVYAIMRKVIENKERNNKNNLDFYEYERYARTEVSIDNITEKFQQKKSMQQILHVLEAAKVAAGEDGKPTIPIFISEQIADVFYRKFPEKRRENIKKEKVTGLLKDTSPAKQFMQEAFQDFNFYNNYIRLFEKDFISPIADSWNLFYDYELIYQENDDDDNPRTTLMDGIPCYKIKFKPKQPQDLAFTGVMWIADSSYHYALKQIDVTITKEANLNFIEKVVIQQQMIEVAQDKGWLPDKTRLIIDIGEIKDDWAGMLIKFYSSNRNFKINFVRPFSFYEQDVVVEADAYNADESYWQQNRHDSLSEATLSLYSIIDTIKKVPVVRTYMEIIDIVVNGYHDLGKVEFGPYLFLGAINDVEGFRFRPGFRTNEKFSEKWVFEAYTAYGTKDNRFKYYLGGKSIFHRERWSVAGISYQRDIDQVGIFSDDILSTELFLAFARFGKLKNPFLHNIAMAYIESDLAEGLRSKITLRHRAFEPLYNFEFYEIPVTPEKQFDISNLASLPERKSRFEVNEVIAEIRYSIGERYVNRGNHRYTITYSRYPVWTFRFTQGFRFQNLGDFHYRKFVLSMQHDIRLGSLGRTQYTITAGVIPSTVPYPLLETHLGNETFFLNARGAYNLMNYLEFVSDRYLSLHVYHRFEGLFFNRIPYLKKLKWRTSAGTRMIYGTVSTANLYLIPYIDRWGNRLPEEEHFKSFTPNSPYAEVFYSIENIFKLLRIDFTHRVTYLHPELRRNFGIRLGIFFRL